VSRHRLSDDEWARVSPHLPAERGRRGRPARDNRLLLDAMLWRLAAGQPWRDLPPEFGPWQSVYTRFSRWRDAGVFDRAMRALQEEAHANGDLDWSLHHVDSTVVRAQRSAAGAKKGEATRPSAAREAVGAPRST
jgi:transposase